MTCGNPIKLGLFTVGEKPAPLVYQFLDNDGLVINLTGYTVKFVWEPVGGTDTTGNGILLVAASGTVQYTWTGTEFAVPGQYQGEFWVGNGTNRWASVLITWTVRAAVGTVPAI